jgi:predicted O-methyltransferase YrrM
MTEALWASLWASMDRFLTDVVVRPHGALHAAEAESDRAGLPSIQVTAPQGKLLHLLARLAGARRILEIGTLGGYSTIWLASALPEDGRLVTLELDPGHAAVARANLERAGVASLVDLRVGPALGALQQLCEEGVAPFDLVFIDADKSEYPEYLRFALALTRSGSLLVGDNVVRNGAVLESESTDPRVRGARRFHELVGAEPRLTATVLQTVGSKGPTASRWRWCSKDGRSRRRRSRGAAAHGAGRREAAAHAAMRHWRRTLRVERKA